MAGEAFIDAATGKELKALAHGADGNRVYGAAATEKELKVQWKLGVLAVKVESKCSNWERIGGRGSWGALWSRGGGGS